MHDIIGLAYRSWNDARPPEPRRDRDLRHPEWTGRLLARFGHPDLAAPNLMVSGSKGKGSHAILLAAMLQRWGLKVGLFTGPHLVDFMERFRINGQMMPETTFAPLMKTVADAADGMALPPGHYFGPVGLLAVTAALWFERERTDINVFECGRGALHDDVNQVTHQGAVVAPVFSEHIFQLGPTLADIGREKAAVATSDTRWVVSHPQAPEVQYSCARLHATAGAGLAFLGEDFTMETRRRGELVRIDVHGLSALPGLDVSAELPDLPPHMLSNAAVSLAAAATAMQTCADIPRRPALAPSAADGGGKPPAVDLHGILLPGRMQVVRERPLTVIDGAIHAQSAQYVANWVRQGGGSHRRAAGRRRARHPGR